MPAETFLHEDTVTLALHGARRPARAPAWKLVVAAEAPWTGELYGTRPGRRRFPFSTVETFCDAVLAATDWTVGSPPEDLGHPSEAVDRSSSTRGRRRTKSTTPTERDCATRKFIVSAEAPWTGVLYRTRPGLGHFPFGTFEGFIGAILDVTGWTLDYSPPRGAAAGRSDRRDLSRPTSVHSSQCGR